jgi:hypothetical protein
MSNLEFNNGLELESAHPVFMNDKFYREYKIMNALFPQHRQTLVCGKYIWQKYNETKNLENILQITPSPDQIKDSMESAKRMHVFMFGKLLGGSINKKVNPFSVFATIEQAICSALMGGSVDGLHNLSDNHNPVNKVLNLEIGATGEEFKYIFDPDFVKYKSIFEAELHKNEKHSLFLEKFYTEMINALLFEEQGFKRAYQKNEADLYLYEKRIHNFESLIPSIFKKMVKHLIVKIKEKGPKRLEYFPDRVLLRVLQKLQKEGYISNLDVAVPKMPKYTILTNEEFLSREESYTAS